MALTIEDNKLLVKSGGLATGLDCCCGPNSVCILQQSGAVAGISGSDVVFDGGGGTFATLDFGVNGYWLGRSEASVEGYTQSVEITFTTIKPFRARLRCRALDCVFGDEKLNYVFTGASTVVFTAEYGSGLTDDGQTVTRPSGSSGDSGFTLVAEGEISKIFFEGEMVCNGPNGLCGTNGIVVEICVDY